MASHPAPRVLTPRRARIWLNCYPPFIFYRIRVVEIAGDFHSCTVRIARSRLTRGLQGTTFGGAIYAAADPFFALLYWQLLAHQGLRVEGWIKSARVRFLKPATSALTLRFVIAEAQAREAREALEREGRHACTHGVDATDAAGEVCATIETEVYLRRPQPRAPHRASASVS